MIDYHQLKLENLKFLKYHRQSLLMLKRVLTIEY
jgi:hypothetical protein